VFADELETRGFLIASDIKRLNTDGYGLVVNGAGALAVHNAGTEDSTLLREGVLFVVEEGLEHATKESERIVALLLNNVLRLATARAEKTAEPLDSATKRLYYTNDLRLAKASFVILNSQGGTLVPVGTIVNNEVSLNGAQVIFPGGVTEPPVERRMPIWFTSGASGKEHNGFQHYMGAMWQTSINLALLDVENDPNMLSNFKLSRHITTFGIFFYSPDFILS
jgi:hypothetical protein